MATVGVVIPAYRPNVDVLSAYISVLNQQLAPTELRVELDAPSTSDTVDRLRDTGASVNVSNDRRGKGAAVTAGFDALDADIYMFLDADGSIPVDSARAILRPIRDGSVEISVGSRRHPAATVTVHQTVVRRLLGDAFAWLARRTLPAKLFDYQCGAKALTADAWRDVRRHLHEEGFAWDFELLTIAAALGYDIAEVPIVWEDQPGSTVEPIAAIVEFSRALLTVRRRARAIREHPVHVPRP